MRNTSGFPSRRFVSFRALYPLRNLSSFDFLGLGELTCNAVCATFLLSFRYVQDLSDVPSFTPAVGRVSSLSLWSLANSFIRFSRDQLLV